MAKFTWDTVDEEFHTWPHAKLAVVMKEHEASCTRCQRRSSYFTAGCSEYQALNQRYQRKLEEDIRAWEAIHA